mgnify:CR=1 FL=1
MFLISVNIIIFYVWLEKAYAHVSAMIKGGMAECEKKNSSAKTTPESIRALFSEFDRAYYTSFDHLSFHCSIKYKTKKLAFVVTIILIKIKKLYQIEMSSVVAGSEI